MRKVRKEKFNKAIIHIDTWSMSMYQSDRLAHGTN